MHAWESIQKVVDYIEGNIGDKIHLDELAKMANLSYFYFHRLFSRLVKVSVQEYIKLRRLAHACEGLSDKSVRILDIALDCGFGGHETFTRAFKDAYGLTPSQFRNSPARLNHFDKPNLLLNYVMVDEGVPLITEGIVFEYNRKTLDEPIHFLGVKDFWQFKPGKMLGERPGVSEPAAIWDKFYTVADNIPCIPYGRRVGVSYSGGAPDGYSTYFVGAEASMDTVDTRFASWWLPPREYIVCEYEAENFEQLIASMGKMMKFTRTWLRQHGLRAIEFFPEIYYNRHDHAYMEMWLPFKKR